MAKYLSLTGLQQYDTKIKEYVAQNSASPLYQHTIQCTGDFACFIVTILSTTSTAMDRYAVLAWLQNKGFTDPNYLCPISGYCSAFSNPSQVFGIYNDTMSGEIYLAVAQLDTAYGMWTVEYLTENGIHYDVNDIVTEI